MLSILLLSGDIETNPCSSTNLNKCMVLNIREFYDNIKDLQNNYIIFINVIKMYFLCLKTALRNSITYRSKYSTADQPCTNTCHHIMVLSYFNYNFYIYYNANQL